VPGLHLAARPGPHRRHVMAIPGEAAAILEFWFGTSADEAEVPATKGSLWWQKSDELDRTIRERFGELRAGPRGASSPRGATRRGAALR
jgi:uncharacterized protein (DUF924 family)